MALGVVFHGAQLALDLAVAGMSLAVALAFFALVTTVLCSAAFLHHSKPTAASCPPVEDCGISIFQFGPFIYYSRLSCLSNFESLMYEDSFSVELCMFKVSIERILYKDEYYKAHIMSSDNELAFIMTVDIVDLLEGGALIDCFRALADAKSSRLHTSATANITPFAAIGFEIITIHWGAQPEKSIQALSSLSSKGRQCRVGVEFHEAKNYTRWLLVTVEAGHGAEERMAVPLNWKGSLSFQLFLITFSTISVPSVATKARGKTFACNAVFQEYAGMKGDENANGGHCLVNWQTVTRPKDMGGLGVPDLERFGRALRLRWLWHDWVDDSKSWSGSELPCTEDDRLLFNSSIIISLGDGAKTKFWHHGWLDDQAPKYLAPNLFRLLSRTNRTVQQELRNNNWMHKLARKITSPIHIEEFVSLWIRIQ
ncbi:unnamed protein product [Miscanthus lutarioriparius]|uniref:Uncharacterized protein n=1 Tax=Miscanthus lutarioriparius TaxID=422564 RepID=A0A811NLN9_9POAL|nr:unnamed protein product [Miscanthus lutarioriparius]